MLFNSIYMEALVAHNGESSRRVIVTSKTLPKSECLWGTAIEGSTVSQVVLPFTTARGNILIRPRRLAQRRHMEIA